MGDCHISYITTLRKENTDGHHVPWNFITMVGLGDLYMK
jgi:hypothetical protein